MTDSGWITTATGTHGLRSFLLDPQLIEATFNTTKAARMEIHRLIDNVIGAWGKLSHVSQGCGHSRYLVVRKVVNDQRAKELSQMRDLRDQVRPSETK